MDGIITGENDERVGLSVIDNNDAEHVIEMEFDGKINYHEQDGYPDDPAERTNAENEHVNQARRYAKYYVYREKGYETLDPHRNPDRILGVALVAAGLSTDSVESYFGDLYRQVRSHSTDSPRPVTLPDGVSQANVTYQQDVYLGLDDRQVEMLEELLDVAEVREYLGDLARGGVNDRSLLGLLADAHDIAGKSGSDLPATAEDFWIEAVSGVHVHWDDAAGQYHTAWTDRPGIDREPDARIEMLPFEPENIDAFQQSLVRGLFCQVRDCYLGMGVTPPSEFRIQGMGSYDHATWYDYYDLYQPYHDPDADIDWDRDTVRAEA
ncbi:hypothetical protein NDI56_14020 [Haloarcula sp. S1CR25-12]|uniref:Uncharacterized protein n=1 Tax=Haloarcula saliterrae TaxID=2950534 RepID=A0ABU2FE28_9EURY|nr:hypothetical protein [Haloarcula sp. S1CR25-12]MDS0260518.1 hypothetical protein [Haloarcula sp. S1CR25-12]